MKKIVIIIIVLAVLGVAGFLLVEKTNDNQDLEQKIIVNLPKANETISSPLEIIGKARGYWFFEASFPVVLLDGNNKEITTVVAQAQSDPATGEVNWMTEDFVDFKALLNFSKPETQNGILIFKKDNPSGLSENDEQIETPIYFKDFQTTTIKIFFNNSKMDPEFSCNKVFPVQRTIPKIEAIARAAIEELLKGPTEQEKTESYLTSINSGVKIQKLTIKDGIARIDFDEQLEFQVGGSCRVSAIRSQITETLKQFSTVEQVIISINDRTEDILQP